MFISNYVKRIHKKNLDRMQGMQKNNNERENQQDMEKQSRGFTTVAKKDFMVTHKCARQTKQMLFMMQPVNCTLLHFYGNNLLIKGLHKFFANPFQVYCCCLPSL